LTLRQVASNDAGETERVDGARGGGVVRHLCQRIDGVRRRRTRTQDAGAVTGKRRRPCGGGRARECADGGKVSDRGRSFGVSLGRGGQFQ
jgi:hypothetical protein